MNDFVWLTYPETGGHFRCPRAAVEGWKATGWEPANEPPAEPSPVVAEHLARREQQTQAAVAAEQTNKPTRRAAQRGTENGEMSDG